MAVVLAVAATSGNGPSLTRSAGPIGVGLLKRSASGVEPRRGMGSLKTRVGLLILLRVGRHVSSIIRGDLLSRPLVSLPPCPKKAAKAARREAVSSFFGASDSAGKAEGGSDQEKGGCSAP